MEYNPYPYQPMMQFFYNGQHQGAMDQFATWLKTTAPAAFQNVLRSRPELLDAGRQVRSGSLGLAGLGTLAQDETIVPDAPLTSWGNQLLELAKGYMAYDAQRNILKLNISRAEKGLPPISSSFLAPQMNVGVSPELQSLGTFALVGLVAVGLVAAFRRGK